MLIGLSSVQDPYLVDAVDQMYVPPRPPPGGGGVWGLLGPHHACSSAPLRNENAEQRACAGNHYDGSWNCRPDICRPHDPRDG